MDRPVHHGNDGRNASSGWYQGCTKTINGEKNGDWDVIVKPAYAGRLLTDAKDTILNLEKRLEKQETLLEDAAKERKAYLGKKSKAGSWDSAVVIRDQ